MVIVAGLNLRTRIRDDNIHEVEAKVVPSVQRMGDANSAGGVINSIPQNTVRANGSVVSVNGSKGTGHGIGIHAAGAWDTANGSSTVRRGGTPVNRTGDADTCAHARVGGSSNVNVG